MRVMTIKAKPKTIFGIILALTGLIVVLLSFVGNHNGETKETMATISCQTKQERMDYISSKGFKCGESEEQKDITIPKSFNDVYEKYNQIQKNQGFDLEKYKGKTATVFTYSITNYKSNDNVIANLIVCDGILIGADLCDTSVDNGFLVGLNDTDNGQT